MIERRQEERSELRYFARVYNRKLGRLIGYLVNITPRGVMVVSEKPIDPGSIVGLYIEFPESQGSSIKLDLEAKCVWSRLDHDSTFFELGFKLHNVQDSQEESIMQIVRSFGI